MNHLTQAKIYGSPGLVVMGGDSCSEGCGFKSQHRMLDGHFFTYICWKNCNDVCLKRPKINDTRGRGWVIFYQKITLMLQKANESMSFLALTSSPYYFTRFLISMKLIRGSITVRLTSCFFVWIPLLWFCWMNNRFTCFVKSKPVKQEVSHAVILPLMK